MKPLTKPPAVTRSWKGETAEERTQQRRERLIEAALEMFGKRGIEHTTMRDICSQARLTERYFYESFANTDEAFDAVYARIKQELVRRVTAALASAPADIPQLASAGLRAFYTFIQEDPRYAQIMLIDALYANRRSISRSREAVKEYIKIVDELAKVLYPDLPANFDVEMVAWGLVGMAVQIGAHWAGGGFKQPIEQVLAYNLYAWHGLKGWVNTTTAEAPKPAKKTAKASKKP